MAVEQTPSTAVILLGRGMPHGEQWAMLKDLAEDLRTEGLSDDIHIAFLEMTEPSISDTLYKLEEEGRQKAIIVPCFTPFDRNVSGWLTRSLATRRKSGAIGMSVVMAPALDRSNYLKDGILQAARDGMSGPDIATVVKPLPDKSHKGGVPPHGHSAYICLGPRCAENGAWELLARMRAAIKHNGLDKGPEKTIVCRSSCLYPCTRAPALVIQPGDIWYGNLTPDNMDEIVISHLRNGRPVERLRLKTDDQPDDPADWPLAHGQFGTVVVDGMYARVAMKRAGAVAVFGALASLAPEADRLIGASSPLSETLRLHDPAQSHGDILIDPFRTRVISTENPIEMRSGGLHLMLFDVKRDLTPGENFPLALHFEKAGSIALQITVQPGH